MDKKIELQVLNISNSQAQVGAYALVLGEVGGERTTYYYRSGRSASHCHLPERSKSAASPDARFILYMPERFGHQNAQGAYL